jgi:hypothetical protein
LRILQNEKRRQEEPSGVKEGNDGEITL